MRVVPLDTIYPAIKCSHSQICIVHELVYSSSVFVVFAAADAHYLITYHEHTSVLLVVEEAAVVGGGGLGGGWVGDLY